MDPVLRELSDELLQRSPKRYQRVRAEAGGEREGEGEEPEVENK